VATNLRRKILEILTVQAIHEIRAAHRAEHPFQIAATPSRASGVGGSLPQQGQGGIRTNVDAVASEFVRFPAREPPGNAKPQLGESADPRRAGAQRSRPHPSPDTHCPEPSQSESANCPVSAIDSRPAGSSPSRRSMHLFPAVPQPSTNPL
jgi:hypothetical protein